jgi:hypothetical protein
MKILILQLPWVVELIHDWAYIMIKRESPNKKVGVVIRVIVSVIASLIYLSKVPEYPVALGPVTSLAYSLILCWAFHFAFFNYTLNKTTGKPLFHLNDGPVDSFEASHFSPPVWLVIRIVTLGLSVAMFYLTPAHYGI